MLNILSLMLLLRAARFGGASFAARPLSSLSFRTRPAASQWSGGSGGTLLGHACRRRPASSMSKMSSSSSASTDNDPTTATDDADTSDGTPLTIPSTPFLALAGLYGGDFAGMSATFSSSTGKLIPVPEHLVPESMIEWGQVPSCLEVLTSEEFLAAGEGEEKSQDFRLERQTVSVMPAVGCGVDNLDVMNTAETFELSSLSSSSSSLEGEQQAAIVAMSRPLTPLRDAARIKLETTFTLPPEVEAEDVKCSAVKEEGTVERSYPRRVRVSCDIIPTARSVSSPVTVALERRISPASSGGSLGKGGGLDGRTVMRLVGKGSVNKPFAEVEEGVNVNDVGGEREGFTTLSLPGNVVIRIGSEERGDDEREEWIVDVGLVVSEPEPDDGDDTGGKKTMSVVRRVFSASNDDDGDASPEWTTTFLSEEC